MFDPMAGATPQKLAGGPANFEIITKAKAVKVYRIVEFEKELRPKKTIMVDTHECDPAAAIISGKALQQLVAAMSDAKNFGGGTVCDFMPGVIFRFESDGRTLGLVVCFTCHEMVFYRDGTIVRRPEFKWAVSKNIFTKDSRKALVATAQLAFPKDAAIQKLDR
jgi:hypothetical protein